MATDTKSRKSRQGPVLGPMPRDQIITDDGERFEKYGCALYTAVALSALLEAGDTIVPVTHVRAGRRGSAQADPRPVLEHRHFGHHIVGRPRRRRRVAVCRAKPSRRAADELHEPDPAGRRRRGARRGRVCLRPDHGLRGGAGDAAAHQGAQRRDHSARCPWADDDAGSQRRASARVWADQDIWLPHVDILKMNLDEAHSMWVGESARMEADPPTGIAEEKEITEELRDLARYCWTAVSGRFA